MGSKKILEEMFKLITKKNGESIEENKFNQSILSSIKVKTQKERDAVLSELLLMLKEGNEAIGEISNGTFVCYSDIIKKKEDFVIKRLETENLYAEKNKEIENDTRFDIKADSEDNKETKSIGEMLERFDDLDDSQFENLLNSLGEMNSSQVDSFIEKYSASQQQLVEEGIKDEDEIEREGIEIRLASASKGNDLCAKSIANTLLLLDNKETSEEELIDKIKYLKEFLADNELSEEAQKLCDEVDVYGIIASLEQQIGEQKLSRKPDVKSENRKSSLEVENDTLIKTRIEEIYGAAMESRWFANKLNSVESGTFSLEGYQYDNYALETPEQQREFLKNEWKKQRYKATKSSRGLFSKEGRRKTAISQRESRLGEDSSHEAKPTVRRAVGRPRPKRTRYVLPFAMAANGRILKERNIQDNINDDHIKDIDLDEFFEKTAIPIKMDPFKGGTEYITPRKARIQPVVGKIEVGSSRPIVKKIERIKAFLTSKAGKKQMEDASKMLFGLITEREGSVPEASFDTENSIKNTNKARANSSKEGQIPDDY